jgi:hypothetical protein
MANITIVDPMGSLVLAPKARKALEKGKLAGIRLEFTNSGVRAVAALPLEEGKKGEPTKWVPIAEAMASIASSTEESRPWAEEKGHLVTKFEVRLDKEAPKELRESSTKVEFEAAIAALPFKERRAFQMSNKEFEMAFLKWEEGKPIPRPADQAEALRVERSVTAKRGALRGRGRGGRGRGSFLGPQAAAGQSQATPGVGQGPSGFVPQASGTGAGGNPGSGGYPPYPGNAGTPPSWV